MNNVNQCTQSTTTPDWSFDRNCPIHGENRDLLSHLNLEQKCLCSTNTRLTRMEQKIEELDALIRNLSGQGQ